MPQVGFEPAVVVVAAAATAAAAAAAAAAVVLVAAMVVLVVFLLIEPRSRKCDAVRLLESSFLLHTNQSCGLHPPKSEE